MVVFPKYGQKSLIMHFQNIFENFSSQKFIFNTRYLLSNYDSNLLQSYNLQQKNSEIHFFGQELDFKKILESKKESNNDITNWISQNIRFEYSKYDLTIPVHYAKPLNFYPEINLKPWNMILLTFNPYTCEPLKELKNPNFLNKFFKE